MTVLPVAVSRGAQEFFGWWSGELKALVPRPVRRALTERERTVALEITGETLTVFAIDGDVATEVERCRLDMAGDAEIAAFIKRVKKAYPGSRWRYGLHLPDTSVLRDVVWLPAAAEENLREAIEFQLGRLTPFDPAELYFDCRVAHRPAGQGTMAVEIAVARRETVDLWTARAAAWGVDLTSVTATGDRIASLPSLNLLPVRPNPTRRRLRKVNTVLAIVAICLGIVAVGLPILHDDRYARRLTNEVQRLQLEARVAGRLLEEIDSTAASVEFIVRRKAGATPVTAILEDLTKLMPDEGWVSRFGYRDGVVRIIARSPESSAIIRLIEQSKSFEKARLVAPVRRRQSESRERFSLSFDVKRPAVETASSKKALSDVPR